MNLKPVHLFIVGLLLVVVLMLASTLSTPATTTLAQTAPETMRAKLEDLANRGKVMSFQFNEPIAPGVLLRDSNGSDMVIGDDHVCFVEPWNDGQRQRCTPYNNIVSVTFID